MRVCKIFRFDAAHYLPEYEGKCRNMHGHTWTLEVEVSGSVRKGMVMDFAVLKSLVKEKVIDCLDHSLLNDIIPNPTCENLLFWIRRSLGLEGLARLRLYETPDSFAEWRKSD